MSGRRFSFAGTAATMLILSMVMLAGCGSSSTPNSQPAAPTPAHRKPSDNHSSHSPGGTSTRTSGAGAPSGGPVPGHVAASSISFVSPSEAFILGTAPCQHAPCSAVLRTVDRGASWVGLPAPREAIGSPVGAGLNGVRFADSVHGYAFGHGLWVTSNGASHWHHMGTPRTNVLALVAVDDRRIVAILADCDSRHGCRHGELATGGLDGRLHTVESLTGGNTGIGLPSLAVHGSDVLALTSSELFQSNDGGARFSLESMPCRAFDGTGGDNQPAYAPGSVAATDDAVFLLCAGEGAAGSSKKRIYRRALIGTNWRRAGDPPQGGDGGTIAACTDDDLLVATSSAATEIYRSTNGGRSWRTPLEYNDGGQGLVDLGCTTTSDAVVVHGPPQQDGSQPGRTGTVVLTNDGGAHWQLSRF